MNLTEEFSDLLSCCMHNPTWKPEDVAEVVLTIEESPEDYCSTDNVTIARLHAGWGMLASWSDTSGHGCRCDALTARGATLHELLTHLTDDELLRILRKAAEAAS